MKSRSANEIRSIVDTFMEGKNKTVMVSTYSQNDFERCISTINKYNKEKNLNLCVGRAVGNHVYMVKG